MSATGAKAADVNDVPLARMGEARGVTWRSFLVGTGAVGVVCGLTPYNDYVLSNTSLVIGFVPLIAVLIAFVLIVGINGPLRVVCPRAALGSGELAVVLLMTLVACGIPNWGLMRFLIAQPVAPFRLGASDGQFWNAFQAMDLPGWLFPVESVKEGLFDPVYLWFYNSLPRGERLPWGAWVRPLVAWGIFAGAMLATLAAMARLVLEQWSQNERLPFPIVQVQAALLEEPRPGRALNDIFRSRSLWVGLGIVFCIHMLACLNTYLPRYFPAVPLGYNFASLFPDPPLYHLPDKVKAASVSFIIVGVTYFIRSRTAFSLWAIFLAVSLVRMQRSMTFGDIPDSAQQDQHLGACIAFIAGMLWIGRAHWMRILRGAIGGDGKHRVAFWIVAGGVMVMLAWLWVVGVHLWMAILIVAFILGAHLVVSRVLAETGLPIYRSSMAAVQVYSNLPIGWMSGRDAWFAGVFTVLGPLTARDSAMTFTMHGLAAAERAGVGEGERRRVGAAIAWSLALGFVIAAGMALWCQYHYPTPTVMNPVPARNWFGAEYVPKRDVANSFMDYTRGKFPAKAHNPALHVGIGFGVTALLEAGALRWAGWPLLPVGFVTSYGAFIGNAWFSIFVGWLLKVLVIRFGGPSLFQKGRPLFIGIIFGEALAAGVWLIVNGALVLNGFESKVVKFLN